MIGWLEVMLETGWAAECMSKAVCGQLNAGIHPCTCSTANVPKGVLTLLQWQKQGVMRRQLNAAGTKPRTGSMVEQFKRGRKKAAPAAAAEDAEGTHLSFPHAASTLSASQTLLCHHDSGSKNLPSGFRV